eukprot:TRINITY_DN34225_c0_g1_i1.p1 TRINITY_DN34225_c0_g1~~TRINITY_DN34225_c0_g1_i1.p1  ORF type:complete len:152 (-),score=17.00 TRINITY_DN34225_c0_g1_i1:28-483(-)
MEKSENRLPPAYTQNNFSSVDQQGWSGPPPYYTQNPAAPVPPPPQQQYTRPPIQEVPPPPIQYVQSPPVTVVNKIHVGKDPISMLCPNCRCQILTRVEDDVGVVGWITAGFLCLMGFWLGCACIPLCMDSFKDFTHFCPSCNVVIGRYKSM